MALQEKSSRNGGAPLCVIYARVSTLDQGVEGTSLESQVEACRRYGNERGFEVAHIIRDTFSGLTLDRPGLQRVLALVRAKETDAVIIYSSDRFSRNGLDLLNLVRECELNGVELLCVSEDLLQGDVGQLLNFVRGWASGLEARKIGERTMRGKRAHANLGDIPAGFGRYQGYLGLHYDKVKKKFVHTAQIEIAREILERGLRGESSSRITRDLQSRGVCGAGGGPIHRSSVNRVLANARVYAGVLTWSGIEIRGKVEPIITEEEAGVMAQIRKRNQEKSRGFGKRKWLTGRVFCSICGRHYNLDSRKGCYCNGADSRNPIRCQSPKLSLMELSALAYGVMIMALSEPESVIEKAQRDHDHWQRQKEAWEQLRLSMHQKEAQWERRRRLLSFQHECGGLTDEEYIKRLEEIKKEQIAWVNLGEFSEPEPPSPEKVRATYDRLRYYKPLRLHFDRVLRDACDKMADDLAEWVDLRVIIGPPKREGHRYSAQVRVNLPIASREIPFPSEEGAWAMVSQSS